MGLPLPVLISPTRVELASRCFRRHLLADHVHLADPQPNPYAAFGTQIHAGVGEWWNQIAVKGSNTVEALEAMLEAGVGAWPAEATSGYHTPELARTLLMEYASHGRLAAESVDDGWEVVEIEARQLHNMGESYLSYQIDRLLKRGDEYLLVDLKTSGRPDARWERSFRTSVQQRLYAFAIAARYGGLPSVWIEGMDKKNPGRLVYVEASADWDRSFVNEAYILAANAGQQVMDLYVQAMEMADLDDQPEEDLLRWLSLTVAPFNLMDCHSYNHPCPYLDLCSSPPNMRRALAATFETAEPWDLESRALLDQ